MKKINEFSSYVHSNTGKKINVEVTEPHEIREEMRNFYQDIFAKQQIIEGPSAIENFLNSDGDYRPLLELKKKNSEQLTA